MPVLSPIIPISSRLVHPGGRVDADRPAAKQHVHDTRQGRADVTGSQTRARGLAGLGLGLGEGAAEHTVVRCCLSSFALSATGGRVSEHYEGRSCFGAVSVSLPARRTTRCNDVFKFRKSHGFVMSASFPVQSTRLAGHRRENFLLRWAFRPSRCCSHVLIHSCPV